MPEAQRWVGQRLLRREDPELLTGVGRFIADLSRPGMLHAVILRSPYPHARLRAVHTGRARALPGVHAVLAGADLPADLPPQPQVHHFEGQRATPYYALARERVRYAGEAVAVVVAESPYVAEDARDLIEVDYELLPAVADAEAALQPDAPRLYEGWPDNVAGVFSAQMGDVERALAEAELVLSERFHVQRQFACPLETRGALAEWDAARQELTFWTSTQIMHVARDFLAQVLGLPEHRIRVRTPRVGGGFGCKFHFYPEEVAVALLAQRLGRPVRWVEDRQESFLATVHAREEIITLTVGARRDGAITAVQAELLGDMGAALHMVSFGPLWLSATLITNVYRVPNARVQARAVVTNKTPFGSYRGWGQPPVNFAVERMLDRLAQALQMDPAALRRKNFIPPEQFPYTGLVHTFDSGRYAACLERGLALLEYDGWRRQQGSLRAQGRHVGIGVSFYVENTALGPSRLLTEGGMRQGGFDIAHVRVEPGGQVTLFTGLCEIGQGFTNGLAQLCADALGVHPAQVAVVTGDTHACPYTGYGTGASRSAAVGGAAVMKAARQLREKATAIAAHMLEAAPDDLEMGEGRIWVRGAPGRAVTMADVGRAAYQSAVELPPGMEPGLEAIAVFDPPQMAWPYGVNLAVVEVDVETCQVQFLDYVYVHDCGTMLNPLVVEGQIHGGVAQGIGMALYEALQYDPGGQLLNGSFMDYLLPTAMEVPRLRLDHLETPSPIIPGGMKGVGEAGVIGSPAAVVNAVEDALRPFHAKLTQTPVTPEAIFRAVGETVQPAAGPLPRRHEDTKETEKAS